MDWCVSVWNPQYEEDIKKKDKVQTKVSRLLVDGNRMNNDETNHLLNISSH